MVDVIESQDCEAVVPGIMEFMTTRPYITDWNEKNLGMGGNKTLYALMRKGLDLYNAPIKAALATSHGKFKQDEPMPDLVKKAAEVTSIGVQAGEGWLLTAEILELIEQGCPNVICAQPFACLPNHVTGRGMFGKIRRLHPEANIVSIDYDPGASEANQLNRIKLMIAAAKKAHNAKFADEVYKIENPTDDRMHFMLPTAETALASLHRGEILAESDLPHKLFAYTPCFRREAGSHRADERGMVRGHQFNKIEMFQYTLPEKSDEAFEELVGKAERLVKGLGFHFRTVKLAAGDCSASMARTYDIEIQIPSMNGYKEVSSVSNARDYQARRGNIRFRREATGKTEFVHTLNGSGLATSRIFPAMVEQNQRADGSVVVPEVLRKYLGGLEVLEKKNF